MKSLILLGLLTLQANAEPTRHRNEATLTTASYMEVIQDYLNQLMVQIKPFGIGALSGATLGALESEIVDPVLANLNDFCALSIQAGALGGAGYMAYTNQDSAVVQEFKKPATALGVLAGLLAWYHFMGEGLGL